LRGGFPNKIGLFASYQTFCPPRFLGSPKFSGWLRYWVEWEVPRQSSGRVTPLLYLVFLLMYLHKIVG